MSLSRNPKNVTVLQSQMQKQMTPFSQSIKPINCKKIILYCPLIGCRVEIKRERNKLQIQKRCNFAGRTFALHVGWNVACPRLLLDQTLSLSPFQFCTNTFCNMNKYILLNIPIHLQLAIFREKNSATPFACMLIKVLHASTSFFTTFSFSFPVLHKFYYSTEYDHE